MGELDRRRIDDVRGYVHTSNDLSETEKDVLSSLLDHAVSVSNGSPDKVEALGQAMAALICQLVRQEVRAPGKQSEAIEVHRKKCRDGWKSDASKAVMAVCGVLVVWMLRGFVS